MTSSPQTLRGSLSQLQRAVSKFYAQLQQRFEGNALVSTMWAAMGNELQSQVESLKKLPHSFWQSLHQQERELTLAAQVSVPATGSHSLGSCLWQAIDIEEPVILRVYAPLIRRLRSDWTEHALDFYILVKAHIARLAQSVQLFSGDPALSLRCAMLLQSFEKEVQEQAEPEPAAKTAAKPKKHPAPTARAHKGVQEKTKTRSLQKLSKRAKPLVRKIKIPGRRAQR